MDDVLGISIIHDPGVQLNLDLIAVHGIQGHPYKTWTHPNGAKWLEDYLPKDMPTARVMTFGYNAQVFTSSRGSVTDFAEQLLQHLTSVRRLSTSTNRPIIFLCHSLGGLVVKKALLLAQEAHDAAAIRKSTIAVIFMGTPHRGSQLASYADLAVTCIKATGIKANTANLHHLKLDSDDLEELGTQFGSLLQSESIKVLTFYELKPTRIAGIGEAVVVPKWSAKLGLGPPLETVIPLDTDHRQIAQFPSRDSKQYNIVISNLISISLHGQIKQSNDDSEDKEWNDVLLWLEALRIQSGPNLLKERAEGTCKWIHGKRPFENWRCSEGPAGLWIFGKPGIGKTVLSSYISQVLKYENGNLVITLYCQSYQSLNDPFHALVRDILFQALQLPGLSAALKKQLSDLKSQTSTLSYIAFDTLLGIVEKMCHGIANIFLIVDGIDELDQKVAELESFLHRLGSLSQPTELCKILVVSRNTPRLEKLLASWQRMAMSTSDSLQDISAFLNQRLKTMLHLGEHRDEVIERLVDGSKGLFLWADLAVSELDHLRTWNEVQALLQNGNRGLDVTYATIIKQLDTSSESLCRIRAKALLLTAAGYRPFRLEEMTELLAIEVSKGFLDPGNKLLGGWSTLSRACGPFLQMNELGAIELIHVSAKEFLMSHHWAKSLAQEHLIDGSADVEMTCLCLSYLNFTAFGRTLREEVKLDVDNLSQIYPVLEYVSYYWPEHFLKSKKINTLQLKLFDQFLNSNCSVTWTTIFYPHFSLKRGETHETILTTQRSILANLEKKLRMSADVDLKLSRRCIDRCRRLLLESTQDSLRVEQFYSGPTAKVTLEKKLRLAECYNTLLESDTAENISSEAFQAAQETLGPMQPLTLKLQRLKLYTKMLSSLTSSSAESYEDVNGFMRLVENHIKVFGRDHVDTLNCHHDLGMIYLIRQDFTEARKHLEPLYGRMVRMLGHTSRVTQSVANNLAACANMQGEYDYAESILYNSFPALPNAAAERLEIDITSVTPYTINALSILAAVLGARSEDRRSEILHQRVIDGIIALDGHKAPRLYESAINKGQALRDQFKYREARKHYHEWLKASDQNLGADSKQSHEIRNRLIDLDHREKKWQDMPQSLKSSVIEETTDGKIYLRSTAAVIVGILLVAAVAWAYLL